MQARPIYSISVSKIDAFHKWIHRQTEDNEEYNNEQTFLATLRGEFVQLPSAKYGECFHAIIEGTAQRTTGGEDGDREPIFGYRFKEVFIPDAQAKHALTYREEHKMGIAEVEITKLYRTRNFDLIVTGKVDRLIGNWIRDTKTKYSSPDVQEDYIDSYQWRSYLDMLGVDIFLYDIFQVSGFKEVKDCIKAKIKPLEPLLLKRYPELPRDVEQAIQELCDYLEFKNLLNYITVSPISAVAREYNLYPDYVWNDDTVLTFGKNRGKKLADVPKYLQWLYGNQILPGPLKEYIKSKKLV